MTKGRNKILETLKDRWEDESIAVGIAYSILILGAVSWLPFLNYMTQHPSHAPIEKAAAKKMIVDALKDPALPDRVLELLNKPETKELLADPEIARNLERIVEELEDTKVFLKDAAIKNAWTKRAAKQALEEKGAERD